MASTQAQGRLIVFEGGEGSGKSTAIQWLKNELESKGRRVVLSREPGGTLLAEKVRAMLFENIKEEAWNPEAEFLLFAAARAQHLRIKIEPQLKLGTWVLCDRFIDSSWVYQGHCQGVSTSFIDHIHDTILRGLRPDLTLFFDVDPVEGLKRASQRAEDHRTAQKEVEIKFEARELEFHHKIREGYTQLLSPRTSSISCVRKKLDAALSREDVQRLVWDAVAPLTTAR